MPTSLLEGPDQIYLNRSVQFGRECHPQSKLFIWTTQAVEQHHEVFDQLGEAVRATFDEGIPHEVIKEYVARVLNRAWMDKKAAEAENKGARSGKRREEG